MKLSSYNRIYCTVYFVPQWLKLHVSQFVSNTTGAKSVWFILWFLFTWFFLKSSDLGRYGVGVFGCTLIYLNLFTVCLAVQANKDKVLLDEKQKVYSITAAVIGLLLDNLHEFCVFIIQYFNHNFYLKSFFNVLLYLKSDIMETLYFTGPYFPNKFPIIYLEVS